MYQGGEKRPHPINVDTTLVHKHTVSSTGHDPRTYMYTCTNVHECVRDVYALMCVGKQVGYKPQVGTLTLIGKG